MLETIITSKARIKLLLKFFLNPDVKAYLRELSSEFGDSTNSIRVELNRLVNAKLLRAKRSGRNVFYSANVEHPLFPEMHSISRKMTGLDKLYNLVFEIGNIESAYIVGDYAQGIDGGVIDLILVGKFDKNKTNELLNKVEDLIGRKIRTLLLTANEFDRMKSRLQKSSLLLLLGNGATLPFIEGSETAKQNKGVVDV